MFKRKRNNIWPLFVTALGMTVIGGETSLAYKCSVMFEQYITDINYTTLETTESNIC